MQARSMLQPALPSDRLTFRTIFGFATRLDVMAQLKTTFLIDELNPDNAIDFLLKP